MQFEPDFNAATTSTREQLSTELARSSGLQPPALPMICKLRRDLNDKPLAYSVIEKHQPAFPRYIRRYESLSNCSVIMTVEDTVETVAIKMKDPERYLEVVEIP